MSQQGWEKWWWHDWLTDHQVQSASPTTRGIWVNLLGHMWANKTDRLELSTEQYCRLAGCSELDFDMFLDENRVLGFCDTSVTDNGRITVLSRRRNRGNKTKENNRLRQQRHRRNAKITHTEAEAEAEAEKEKSRSYSPSPTLEPPLESKTTKGGVGGKPPAEPATVDGLDRQAWEDYVKHRRDIRARKLKPASTERLQRWLAEQPDQAAVVDQTIRNGWTGLFELRGNGNGRDRHETAHERNDRKLREWVDARKAGGFLGGDAGTVWPEVGSGVGAAAAPGVGKGTEEPDA